MSKILKKKEVIVENRNRREIIRTLVKDIITVVKNNGDGEYYLPMDLTDEDYYSFPKFPHNLVIELNLVEDEDTDGYKINGEMYREDDLMVIDIQYNPEEKQKLLYSIIGELNEIIAHEIRHFDQYRTNKFDFSGEEEEDPVKYYTDPKELDAQVYGFNRLSKLSKKPFKEVVKNWFDTHKEFHNLEPDEVKYVIGKILDYKSTY
jgi:hypothetical protein